MDYDPEVITLERIFEVIQAQGYTPSLEAPQRPAAEAAALGAKERASLDIRTVSRGKGIRIEEHLVAGKFTILDYYADWCGPCLLLSHELERLLAERSDLALRKVDIVSWESEAAKQIKAFGIKGIPYLRVYGPQGSFLGAVNGNEVSALRRLMRKRK